MKKTLLLMVLIVGLGFLNATIGQNVPSSATWPLTDPSASGTGLTAVTTGQVTAASENLVGLTLGAPAYKVIGTTTMQRSQMTGGWPAGQTAKVNTVYTEYAVTSKAGFIFHVDSIALSIAALSLNTIKADIYYSTDPTFASATQIPYTTGLTVGSSTNVLSTAAPQRVKASSLGLALNPGQTLYVRVYPWIEGLTAASTTGKYLMLLNVVVGGEVEGLPVASSIVWPCTTDLSSVVTGNIVAGTPTFNSPLVRLNQNLAYGGVTGVSFYTNAVWQAETAPAEGRYLQFSASPKTGGTLVVDSITLKMAAWSTNDLRVSVYYSKDPSFTLASGTALVQDVPVINASFSKTKGSFSLTVNSGETIYFRLYPYSIATSGDKNKLIGLNDVYIYGNVTGVTSDPPTIANSKVSYISTTFASTGGNVSSDGGAPVTAKGVCWATTAAPTIANNITTNGTGSGAFTSKISGLTPGTLYHMRAYATNSAGTSYGGDSTFTTLAAIVVPTVTKTAASGILVKWANAGGNATAWGGDTIKSKGVCWNTTGNPTISDSKTVNGTDLGSFTSILYPLTQNTKYYFRAYATNSAGTGYSVVDSLTTLSPLPDVTKVVAKDGSGDYTTIQAAFDGVTDNYTGRWIIRVKSGTYKEKVTLASTKVNVYLVGIHPDSTILTYDAYAGQLNNGVEWGTNGCFSVAIDANDFTAMNITFQNTIKNDQTHGSKEQAVALRTKGDRQQYYNCKLKGYQDTYYTNSNGRIYMKKCYIEGSVDFIFGNGVMVLDSCETYCNREGGVVTAPNTDASSLFGYVFLNSKLSSLASGTLGFDNKSMVSFYLGRPWNNSPKSVYLNCDEPATLNALGWTVMTDGLNPYFAEYKCTGAGSGYVSRSTNVNYPGRQLTDLEAANYTIANIFAKTTSPSFGFDWIPTPVTDQLISITSVAAKKYGDVFALPATGGNSGNVLTLTSLTPAIATVSGSNVTVVGVGTAKIKASQAGNVNYLPALDSVKTFITTKADLTATADNKTKTYGDANPPFTVSYTGFVNSETSSVITTAPSVTTSAIAASVVGDYDLTVGTDGAATNYNIVPATTLGKLSVTKATLTAKADDMTKKHGEANPVFTITYTGFVNGDTKASITEPAVSSTADATTGVGTYPIALTGGSAANYSIALTNGTLTITPGTAVNTAKAAEILIYPNPASNVIKVKRASSAPETLIIFSMNGSKIIEKNLVSDLEDVNITMLPKGTYILKLEGMIYKIVVQ